MSEYEEYWNYNENSAKIQANLRTIWGCAYDDTDEDEIEKIQRDPELIQVLCRAIVQQEQVIDRLRDERSDVRQKLSDLAAIFDD